MDDKVEIIVGSKLQYYFRLFKIKFVKIIKPIVIAILFIGILYISFYLLLFIIILISINYILKALRKNIS